MHLKEICVAILYNWTSNNVQRPLSDIDESDVVIYIRSKKRSTLVKNLFLIIFGEVEYRKNAANTVATWLEHPQLLFNVRI